MNGKKHNKEEVLLLVTQPKLELVVQRGDRVLFGGSWVIYKRNQIWIIERESEKDLFYGFSKISNKFSSSFIFQLQ